MDVTIETAVEILTGSVPRQLNIKLDGRDKTILKSISNQISKNIALTDRQAEMLVRKIERYRGGLELNGLDVSELLEKKSTRLPLRFIDRAQTVSLVFDQDKGQEQIMVVHQKTKKFEDLWSDTRKKIQGRTVETFSQKIFPLNENNLNLVADLLTFLDFDVNDDIAEYLEKIQKIHEESEKYQPYLDLVDENFEIKNLSATAAQKILGNSKNFEKDNLLG